MTLALCMVAVAGAGAQPAAPGANPIIRDRFTADPAPLTVGDRLYLYAGHDEAKGKQGFTMNEWLAYSTTDMTHWTAHGPIMKPTDFKWAVGEAWASQMVRKDGKYYFYVSVEHDKTHPGKAIGVAVSESPTGPFVDARGSALVQDNKATWRSWSDIDPTVFTDDDGTSWLAWGNSNLYLAKLKPNMTEIDGPVRELKLEQFLEGPWLHKYKGLYYMTYASIKEPVQKKERISYSTAKSLAGPWTFRGELTGEAANSFTIHAGIEQFKGKWYFFYHNGALTIGDEKGGEFRRSVAVEELHYDPDGSIRPIRQTAQGVSQP
jgi:beta-xylosidase